MSRSTSCAHRSGCRAGAKHASSTASPDETGIRRSCRSALPSGGRADAPAGQHQGGKKDGGGERPGDFRLPRPRLAGSRMTPQRTARTPYDSRPQQTSGGPSGSFSSCPLCGGQPCPPVSRYLIYSLPTGLSPAGRNGTGERGEAFSFAPRNCRAQDAFQGIGCDGLARTPGGRNDQPDVLAGGGRRVSSSSVSWLAGCGRAK